MLKDITLGQYYPAESWIHHLDARVKILSSIAYIVSLFLIKSFYGFILAIAFLAVVTALSTVPLKFMLRGLKPILVLIAFTFVLNLFMTNGDILWQWWILKITRQGIYNAAFMALRLIFLILGSSLLTLTTKPLQLTDGLERLLSPLAKIGLPAHELAMMMSIALRFIPTLMEETDKIMKAQMARGADFETGNLAKRAKSLVPLLVPLFLSAFRIAQDLAMAMEARCYHGGEGRTRMHESKLGKSDALAALLVIGYVAAIVILRPVLTGLPGGSIL